MQTISMTAAQAPVRFFAGQGRTFPNRRVAAARAAYERALADQRLGD